MCYIFLIYILYDITEILPQHSKKSEFKMNSTENLFKVLQSLGWTVIIGKK